MLYSVLLILFSCAGLILSFFAHHVRHTAHRKGHSTCPSYYQCWFITEKTESKFLGVPVEWISFGLFSLIFLFSTFQLLFETLLHPTILLLIILSALFLFGLLIIVSIMQLLSFKKISWWIGSLSMISLIVFIATLGVHDFNISALASANKPLLIIVHAVAAAVGLGAVTTTDIFFFRFLKDFKISAKEAALLHHLSDLIWFAIGFVVVFGFGIFISNPEVYSQSPKFLAKMIVFGAIIINGIALNMYISPKLIHISFGEEKISYKGELHILRRIAFASGAISFISWYATFILGMLRSSYGKSLSFYLIIYFVLILGGVIGSQIMERMLDKKASSK